MANNAFSEEALELGAMDKVAILGYEAIDAYSESFGDDSLFGRKTPNDIILPVRLRQALVSLNPNLPNEAIDKAFYALSEGQGALSAINANHALYTLLKDGVLVDYKDENGIDQEDTVRVIDWNDTSANELLIVRQFKVSGEMYNCRADMVTFINGLPVVLIELKASHKSLINGFTDNITHYKAEIPQLFLFNAFIIVSNGSKTKLGTMTSEWEHFSEWKKINSEGEEGIISLDTVIQGTLEKKRLLDLIENFIIYMDVKGGKAKIIAKNHQYLGVNNTIEAVQDKDKRDGKLGVFWHTQGSGKSFSMVFFTQKILRKLKGNWTFLIVTDREDLDDQIYKNFVSSGAVTEPDVRATGRENLKKLLSEDHRNIFTMIQKFGTANQGDTYEEISDRDDIIVITDEAHRTQYNVLAMNMRKALPNASFLAFTGTPLMRGDEKTKEVFGDYISIYNFKQSVEDKATVKLYYESRLPELQIINEQLQEDIEEIIEDADLTDEQEEKFASTYVNTYELITRNDRLDKIAEDVVKHFMERGFMGKAMYIAIDKATAVKMYDKVQEQWVLYIDKLEKQLLVCEPVLQQTIINKISYMKETDMAVIVSKAQNEIEKLKAKGVDIVPHRKRMNKEDLDEKFKDPDNLLRIAFVCAMWVTGFDAPSVSTLYLDKILKDHTLMQTMARANRVWQDKPDGMVVDYIGIFQHLQKALAIYGEGSAGEDGGGDPVEDKNELVKMLIDASTQLSTYLKARNVSVDTIFNEKDHFKKIKLLDDAVEAILENDETKDEFLTLAGKLKVMLKAVLPDVRAEPYLKQTLVASILIAKVQDASATLTGGEKERQRRVIEALSERVATLLDESITLDDYDIKDSKPFDITQVDFDELQKRFFNKENQKTILERLKSSLAHRIQDMLQVNGERKEYSEKFEELIENYNAGDVDAEQLLLALVKLARSLDEEEERHIRENLTEEELVIVDILTRPEPKLAKNEIKIIKEVAKELLDKLKNEKLVLDWRKKQATRAKVRETISTIFDEKLPGAYDVDIFQVKCDKVYNHIYDNYPDSNHRASNHCFL